MSEQRDTWADRIQKAREAREGALRAKEIREEQERKNLLRNMSEQRDTWADRIQKAREAREGALRAKEIREEQERKNPLRKRGWHGPEPPDVTGWH